MAFSIKGLFVGLCKIDSQHNTIECDYVEHPILFISKLSVIIMNVIILSVMVPIYTVT